MRRCNTLCSFLHTPPRHTLVHTFTLQGTVVLDEAQYDYLLMLIDGDRSAIEASPPGSDTLQLKEQAGSSSKEAVAVSAPSGSGSGAGVDPSLSPLISQIRDMLPEYGSGFLAACLEHYGRKAEQASGERGPACSPFSRALPTRQSLWIGASPLLPSSRTCTSPPPPLPPSPHPHPSGAQSPTRGQPASGPASPRPPAGHLAEGIGHKGRGYVCLRGCRGEGCGGIGT